MNTHFVDSSHTSLKSFLNYADNRVKRNDSYGASESIRNMYIKLAESYSLDTSKLKPIKGNQDDMLKCIKLNMHEEAVQILMFISQELKFGRYTFLAA